MSYAKTIFFIPIWFDDYKSFCGKVWTCDRWEKTEEKKVKPSYLFHYASNLAVDSDLFQSYSLKDRSSLNLQMHEMDLEPRAVPAIEDVRLSCFATGVGFMEFWVSYSGMTTRQITDFAYEFKKATKQTGKERAENKRPLAEVAQSLLPRDVACQLFFSASAQFKCECNCLHFIHEDKPAPQQEERNSDLHHLCRSYKSTMPVTADETYGMLYEAGAGDYWCGSTEGLANVVYDYVNDEKDPSHYYLHTLKPLHLSVDYYFMYLLLLNQKYTSLQYIYMVSKVIGRPSKEIESLNKRIIQLKNVFSFNVISDDQHFQNIYARMFAILEIKNLLADVIENEKQTEFLQSAKHAQADRMSNKYLLGISVLSLFSALIDAASYLDRFEAVRNISTSISFVLVIGIAVFCVAIAIRSIRN